MAVSTLQSQAAFPALLQTGRNAPGGPAGEPTATDKEKALQAAKNYEGVFLSLMMKEMFSGLKTEGDFTGGFGEEMFRDMLSEQYAETIVDTGGIGLADSIYREILTLQEVGNQ